MKFLFKKVIPSLLAIIIIFAAAPFGGNTALDLGTHVSALDPSGSCGTNVTYSFDSSTGKLVISGTGKMTDYSSSSSPFNGNTKIKSVVIQSGVTGIGNYAFYSCSALRSVSISENVTRIGNYAFSGCSVMTGVIIPDSVTSIGNYAFSNCSALSNLSIGRSVASIGNYAFFNCIGLISVTIPDSVTSIGSSAFQGCSGLTSAALSGRITAISNSIFYNCGSLSDVTIPAGVTQIGDSSFNGCISLTSIIIPDSVTSIGNNAFRGCLGLTDVQIGSSVTSIGDYSFNKCTALEFVILPASVQSIGLFSFINVQTIKIYNSSCSINNYAISLNATIYGYIGSTAETYANSRGNTFIDINFTPADYTAVYAALDSVPDILVYYTDESVEVLNTAIAGVEYGLSSARQSDVDAMADAVNDALAALAIRRYNIAVSGEGCSVSQYLPEGSNFYLATVRAPAENSAGERFTYWKDSDGVIVSTYRNYTFYAVDDAVLIPEYTSSDQYESARQGALIASRALDAKVNADATVLLYAEHSVSSAERSINGHGMIVTTNGDLANQSGMVRGYNSEDIHDYMARSTSNSLTGALEARVNLTGENVWVRSYVIDKNGVEKYGEIKSFSLNVSSSSNDEDVILDSVSLYDTAEQNVSDDIPSQDDEAAGKTLPSVLEMIINIIERIVSFVADLFIIIR